MGMGVNLKGNGKKANNMEKVSILIWMEEQEKEYGTMDKG
jgi:hypothetical protein